MRAAKPRKRVQPVYSYQVQQGKKKISVPLDERTDRKLTKRAIDDGKSKAALAAELLAAAI